MNSGGRSPATQNFCLGVWARTGFASYQLNHFALSYDLTTGVLNGKVQIQETIRTERRREFAHWDIYDRCIRSHRCDESRSRAGNSNREAGDSYHNTALTVAGLVHSSQA